MPRDGHALCCRLIGKLGMKVREKLVTGKKKRSTDGYAQGRGTDAG